MLTSFNILFSYAQGQLTQKLMFGYGRNSNSFKLSWLSLLSARMKIHPKLKALDCSVGPQNAPLHNMLLLVAYCVPCIHNMLRWSILCTLHTQYATRGAYCVGSVHMLFQWSYEGTQYALLENMSRGICLSF